jgi:hypothetical protein
MAKIGNLASFYFRNVVREPESGRPAQGSAVSCYLVIIVLVDCVMLCVMTTCFASVNLARFYICDVVREPESAWQVQGSDVTPLLLFGSSVICVILT